MAGVKLIHTKVQFESLVQRQRKQQWTEAAALLKTSVSIEHPSCIFCGYILLPEGATLHWMQGMDVSFSLLLPLVFMPFPFLLPPITHRTLTHVFSTLFMGFLWLLGNSRNQAIYPDREEKVFDSALQEEHWSQGGDMSRKAHWIFLGAMQLSWDGRQAGIWRSNSLAQMSVSPWD